jgi:hypothetical protein
MTSTEALTHTNGGVSWSDDAKKRKAIQIVELRNKLDETRAKLYFDDPVAWARDRLGAHLWSRQRDAAMAIVKDKRVAIRSSHAVGKSFLASVLAAWWVDTRPPGEAMVVTTAPSYEQVHSILWEEIRRLHGVGKLRGDVHRSDRWIDDAGRLVGFGRRPPDYSQHAFQGIHKKRRLQAELEEARADCDKWMKLCMDGDAARSSILGDLVVGLSSGVLKVDRSVEMPERFKDKAS